MFSLLSPLLVLASSAAAESGAGAASAVSTTAPATPPTPIVGPRGLNGGWRNPGLRYSPNGTWVTSNLGAAANTTGEASVSLSALGDGFIWSFADDTNVTALLVDGATAASLNATTVIQAVSASISGLPFGWHNFTLVTNGGTRFNGGNPNISGSHWPENLETWTPSDPVKADPDNPQDSLFKISGNWSTENSYTTTEAGAAVTITPPNGTAVLEVSGIMYPPFPPFDVSVSPPPPFQQPANQSFTPTLFPTEIVAAIGFGSIVIYRVELDPAVAYTVEIQYMDDAASRPSFFQIDSIGAYQMQLDGHEKPPPADNPKPNANNSATKPMGTSTVVVAFLSLAALLWNPLG